MVVLEDGSFELARFVITLAFKKVEHVLFCGAQPTFHFGHRSERLVNVIEFVAYVCDAEIYLLPEEFIIDFRNLI